MGNVIARDRSDAEAIDREAGANQLSLDELLDTRPYLTEHSDLVALMILEHQSQMHNLIARASFETRMATHYDRSINAALDRPLDTVSESTGRRIAAAGEELIRYLLFVDEFELSGPIRGTSKFVEGFAAKQNSATKFDQRGRTLRELDLNSRLFKYPCSYLIYSAAFDALPAPMMDFVKRRLLEILTSEEAPEGYEQLCDEDRRAVYEILRDTKPAIFAELQ